MHKSEITLTDVDGREIVQVPVVWKRIPYLHTVPDRVSLADRPILVFLQCPDLDVEFVRIISAVDGIRAIITGPREITVRVADVEKTKNQIINEKLIVQTNRADLPPIEIPVIRYAMAEENATGGNR